MIKPCLNNVSMIKPTLLDAPQTTFDAFTVPRNGLPYIQFFAH